MVSAVVLTDFTADGVTYQKGQTITVPDDKYDQWAVKNLVGPGGGANLVGPGGSANLVGPGTDDK